MKKQQPPREGGNRETSSATMPIHHLDMDAVLGTVVSLWALGDWALGDPRAFSPASAMSAMLRAGEAGRLVPPWAVESFQAVVLAKQGDRTHDLNQLLGFAAKGTGKTSEFEWREREHAALHSHLSVSLLVTLGHTVTKSCWMEAGRVQRLDRWNTTDYDVGPDLGSKRKDPDPLARELYDKRLSGTERLRKDYYARKARYTLSPMIVAYATTKRAQFLTRFPAD